MTSPYTPDVAIIGAGPAGLMAAEVLARTGFSVSVHERMPSVGRKLLMAGRGGLNLTHSEPLATFLTRYGPEADWLAPAIRAFPPDALRRWAEALGQETFTGTSGRVFPRALKASPLLRAWLARLNTLGVAIHTKHRWSGWTETGALRIEGPEGPVRIRPRATLLALGGASWPRLGSDGAWVDVLRAAGVEVADLRPANAGFQVAWSDMLRSRHAGVPLKRIAIAFAGETVRGEAVITAAGIEGGAIYALSRTLREAIAETGQARIAIDLRPDLSLAELTRRLTRPRNGQSLSNFLRKAAGLAPPAISLLREAGAVPDEPVQLAATIKAVPLTLTGIMPLERAISTAGGVMRAATDAHGMLIARPGVFVAGEMLDWEAPTGGYLLQATFATANAAAKGIEGWLKRPARPA